MEDEGDEVDEVEDVEDTSETETESPDSDDEEATETEDVAGEGEEDEMDEALSSRDVRDMLDDDEDGTEAVEPSPDADTDSPTDSPADSGSDLGDGDSVDTPDDGVLEASDTDTGDGAELPEEADTGDGTGVEEDTDEAGGFDLGDGSDGDAGGDSGGGTVAGLAEMDAADVEGVQDAVEEADDISDFFEERGSGEGGMMEEMTEMEGFFEPEQELEEDFSEEQLNTLLSEAKQGVADFEGMEGYVEHERYWVNKPYAYVAILYSDAENDYMYYVVEPNLDDFEEAVRRDLEERLRDVLMYEEIDDEMDEDEVLEQKTKKIIDD
ncbi:MAG: hypothetical protein SV760_08515, partial [Halobacteria archaeon]|nr:hypothetical protein [Halobacteria archaeon]